MGFIPWAPIGGGRNPSLRKTGNAFEAKRNVTRQPGATRARVVATKIAGHVADPGTSSLTHLEENMATAKLQLPADEWKRIEDLARTS